MIHFGGREQENEKVGRTGGQKKNTYLNVGQGHAESIDDRDEEEEGQGHEEEDNGRDHESILPFGHLYVRAGWKEGVSGIKE